MDKEVRIGDRRGSNVSRKTFTDVIINSLHESEIGNTFSKFSIRFLKTEAIGAVD